MKSFRGINIPVTEEETVYLSRLEDLVGLCEKRYSPQYTDFADERKLMLAEKLFRGMGFARYAFFGGYTGAERKVICVYPEYTECREEDFPIEAVKYTFRRQDKVTHPQVLGTVMSLGLKRELVGDIIVKDGEAAVFFCGKGAEMALSVEKIGRVGVKAETVSVGEIHREAEFTEISASVSSMRLDCVVSAAANLSRERSSSLIRSEGIPVNHVTILSPDHKMKDGDVFSVRGRGKFILSESGRVSKRGKNFITLKKYKN